MTLPFPPVIPEIEAGKASSHITASQAERLLECPLRFLLDQSPVLRRLRPYSAGAVVGTAVHSALAALIRIQGNGGSGNPEETTRAVARRAFDHALVLECHRRDQAIGARGAMAGDSTEAPSALPFYGMTRARFARVAEERFGARWPWVEPSFDLPRLSYNEEANARLQREVEAELPLQSADGLVRGVADSVDRRGGDVVIEEFKSGEATPERLVSWRHQLLIYASLYREQFGHAPVLLRVCSLASGVHEFPYVQEDAENAMGGLREAIRRLNEKIAAGVSATDLAQPSKAGCATCAHRPWCETYWSSDVQDRGTTDTEAIVIHSDGWKATVALPSGAQLNFDFRAAQIAISAGMRLRICGARLDVDGSLRCTRSTSVWRVRT